MNKTKLIISAIILGLGVTMLAACDDDVPAQTQYIPTPQQQQVDEQYVNQQPPQVIQSAPAPVIVQGGHDSGVGDFATGMILGHMMSGGSNNSGGYSNNSSRTTIINNNTVAQPRGSSSYSAKTTRLYDGQGKQVYQSQPRSVQTQSRPTMSTNSSYSAKKSYSSPMSNYSKPSRSYSSKSYSSSRSSFSSSRRR